MALSSLANIMTAVVIGFIYSWKLTLVVLAFFPFMIIAGFLQMKVMQGSTSEGKEANEETGKVRIIKHLLYDLALGILTHPRAPPLID